MRVGSFTGGREGRSAGARLRLLTGVALAGALLAAGLAWRLLDAPRAPAAALPDAAITVLDTTSAAAPSPPALAPPREYPALAPEDLWPERPPFALVRGFGPPPPPGRQVSYGPVQRFGMSRFDVDAAIEQLFVTPTNELPTPVDASYRVGWYADFGQPGQGGNAVFSAHETWNHYEAPFYRLAQTEIGDEVTIDMADGRRLAYSVISNVRYELHSIPMDAILWPPARGADDWITLITCGGRIVYDERTGFGEYLDRDVVVARRIR